MDWFLYDNGLRHERVKWENTVKENLYSGIFHIVYGSKIDHWYIDSHTEFSISRKVKCFHFVMCEKFNEGLPSPHILVQSQEWKQQNNAGYLFKANNRENKTMSLTFLYS